MAGTCQDGKEPFLTQPTFGLLKFQLLYCTKKISRFVAIFVQTLSRLLTTEITQLNPISTNFIFKIIQHMFRHVMLLINGYGTVRTIRFVLQLSPAGLILQQPLQSQGTMNWSTRRAPNTGSSV